VGSLLAGKVGRLVLVALIVPAGCSPLALARSSTTGSDSSLAAAEAPLSTTKPWTSRAKRDLDGPSGPADSSNPSVTGAPIDPTQPASGDVAAQKLAQEESLALQVQVSGADAHAVGIPLTVLAAYRQAEALLAQSTPSCHLPWWLLAGIGRIESGHAQGGRVDAAGTTRGQILGPRLDGSSPGSSVIRDTDGGSLDGDPVFDRAVGPMQFLPGTWKASARDGNGDRILNPNNVFDAATTAGVYLCRAGQDLSVQSGLDRAVLAYNHSDAYRRAVLAWGLAYRDHAQTAPDSPGSVVSEPAATPTESATSTPTRSPSESPTGSPTSTPVESPTSTPVESPTSTPAGSPASTPVESPSSTPVGSPTSTPASGTDPAVSPPAGPAPETTSGSVASTG
jgi:membrane-bound lytic murein transglycosylase B